MEPRYDENARVFKALCDPNRLMIIDRLRTGEKCACRLLDVMDIAQSTLSHHMKILCDSGLVMCRKDGKWTYYSLSSEGCETARKLLVEITEPTEQGESERACACKT